ncbi:unnamed protein product [Pleuronectes platessa]|uniref:Uncharacterized protein n=1 Tax=Pleuronectes platessa TaxID=8262 RepID=A0A9N7YEH9_PLEPL|nr:unnamed protein product [Pleuronectes platessa]
MEQGAGTAARGAENTFLKRLLDAENTALKKKGVYNVNLVEENIALKKKLIAANKALMEQLNEKAALGAENTALKKQAVYNLALVEEKIVLKKKLDAANTVIKEHVAEKAIWENLAGVNADLAADRHALKKELTDKNATLRRIFSTASQMNQAGEELFKIVETSRIRDKALEKKLEDLKTTLKEKEKENFSLSVDLQLQDQDKVIVEHKWKEKFKDLQENYEEKLRCSVLEQVEKERKTDEAIKLLILQKIELQRFTLKTSEYREKVKKEMKGKKNQEKQEKKEQQEREKKEKEERKKLKKREKKEEREEEVWKMFSCFCFK